MLNYQRVWANNQNLRPTNANELVLCSLKQSYLSTKHRRLFTTSNHQSICEWVVVIHPTRGNLAMKIDRQYGFYHRMFDCNMLYIVLYIYIIPWNPCARCLKHLKTNCWPCRQKTCYKVSYQIHHIHIFPSNFWLELVMYIMKYHELSWNIPIHTPIKKIIKRSFPGLEGCDEAAGSGVHVDANLVFF